MGHTLKDSLILYENARSLKTAGVFNNLFICRLSCATIQLTDKFELFNSDDGGINGFFENRPIAAQKCNIR